MTAHGMGATRLVGNVYLLNGRVASLFHDGRVPGVLVTGALS
jgi:methylenetetrahydrofolate reductase (NADPH)